MTRSVVLHVGFVLVFLVAAALCFAPMLVTEAHGEGLVIKCYPETVGRLRVAAMAIESQGTVTELKDADAVAYMRVVMETNNTDDERLKATDIVLMVVENRRIVVIKIADGQACLIGLLSPQTHEAAMKAVEAGKA